MKGTEKVFVTFSEEKEKEVGSNCFMLKYSKNKICKIIIFNLELFVKY